MFLRLSKAVLFMLGVFFFMSFFYDFINVPPKPLKNKPFQARDLPKNETSVQWKPSIGEALSSTAQISSPQISNLKKFREKMILLRRSYIHLDNETLQELKEGQINEIRNTLAQELQEVANLWLQNASANPRKVLILTTWRSGSTFFGELLNQFPGSYYFFEPLIEQHVQRGATNSTQMDILEHLFNCNYQDIRYSKESKWILRHNSRLMPICKKTLGFKEEDLCLDSDFLSKVCALFPIRLMKTVRLETRNVEDLMKKLPGLKVISLIRDPRGIVASRERMPWCSRPQCSDVQHVCERYNRDVESSFEFRSKFSERFMVVRYEDMSLNLYRTVQRVSEFLDFSLSEKIISYIQNHTNLPQFRARKGHDMSLKHSHGTFRNTKSHTFEWRSTIKSEALNQTQQLCASGMNRMGYKLVPSIGVLHNPNIKLMDQIY